MSSENLTTPSLFQQPRLTERESLFRLLRLIGEHKLTLVAAQLGVVIVGLANSVVALVVAGLMDLFSGISSAISSNSFTVHLKRSFAGVKLWDFQLSDSAQAKTFLISLTFLTLGIIVIKGVVHFGKEYLLWKVTHRLLWKVKVQLFDRVIRFPVSFFDQERSGEVLSRATYDVVQLENALRVGSQVMKSVIYAVIYLIMMIIISPLLTLLALMVFPISALVIRQFSRKMSRAAQKLSRNVADYTSFLEEAVGGSRVIKAFNLEDQLSVKFRVKMDENYKWGMKGAKYATINSPAQEIIATLGVAILVLFCGLRMLSGEMTIGDFSGFLVLVTNAYKPIKDLGEVMGVLKKAIVSSQRIFEMIDLPEERNVIRGGGVVMEIKGKIEFRDVRFSYRPDEPVLRGISLTFHPGETLALVGPSGSGKSTLISLIPRFYPVTQGAIYLDDRDIREYDLSFLRSRISVVPQETVIFSGTIAENILLGNPEANFEQMVKAAELANAHKFIQKLPHGYHTFVGGRGFQLSGGERQRIAIARAFLRDPKILLLDEATSALDSESEELIQEAIERLKQNRTTIIIAHRLSTVLSADVIAVLVEGKIVELGNHRELYARGGVYRRLFDTQLKAGERG